MNLFRKRGVAEGMENSRRDESQRGVHLERGDVAVIFGGFWRPVN